MSQSQRSVPAPFLTKTYQLVDDRSTDEVISWNEDGTTFVVWKTAEFAKDLLPNYFKHNNFSSFVRQLNTYGFRKIVPDKWEFANDNFKRGQKELLSEIRRRKTVAPPPAPDGGDGGKSTGSPSISGDDLGSSTTSSPDSKNLGSLDSATISQFANLTDENEKLRKEKELLSSELAKKKKQCDELVAFLAQYLKVGLDQVDRIVREGRSGSIPNTVVVSGGGGDGGDGDQKGGEGLKLFGVWLEAGKEKKKKKNKKKRANREEKVGLIGPCPEDMKTLEFQHCPPLKSSKVCN